MQEYLQHTRLGEAMDALGFRLLALALSMGWFILLWGLRLPALLAGAALFILVLLIEKKTRDERLLRREKKLRARIGGELALERLLLTLPDRAHFETAMLLSLRHPLTLLRAGDEGMLCSIRGETLLLSFVQAPLSAKIGAGEVLALQRAAKSQQAVRAVLCAPCPVAPEAREQAGGEIPVSFLSRDTLIDLFGQANPATDAQLVALGRRRRSPVPARRWLKLILDRRRAPRYALYGGLLLGMYLLTHLFYYALPGLICLGLAAACRCVQQEKEKL